MWRNVFQTQKWRVFLILLLICLILCAYHNANAENILFYGYNTSDLNIRAEMDVESEWKGQYPSESTIEILEDCGEWYRVNEGYVKKEFVYDNIEIYRRGKILESTSINAYPFETEETMGEVNPEIPEIFIRKVNGYLELMSGGYILEKYVTFDFVPEVVIEESTISLQELTKDNMQYLRIKYLGTLPAKTVGDGVTKKSALYFNGQIPIYDIINGIAYFPSGRNIYKISADKFTEIKNVGPQYDILAAYRTIYYSSSQARKHNISLVSSFLDGTVIKSGRTFSYNKTTGPRSASKGYEKANVISNGEYVEDYGGGVCQVSSTIYAAIMNQENFKVTARKEHGLPVTYLPLEMDATVSYGAVDFKFINKYPFSVKLNVFAQDGVCLVTITRTN